jgi:hypothetical protein
MLTNSQGRRFHPESFMYMVEDAKRQDLGIGAFQLVEQGSGVLLFRIVRDPGYSARTEEFLRQRVRDVFDAAATVRFEQVDTLQREPSGKLRVVKALPASGGGA